MSAPGLHVFVGTEAELIKLLPVLHELKTREVPFRIIASGQNPVRDSALFAHLDLAPDVVLSNKPIRQTAAGLMSWFARTLLRGSFDLNAEFKGKGRESVLLVHGDTVSTLMGAVLGRRYGLTVAHLEAGLRSFNYMHPFPEELCRVFVSRMARLHFCPNRWAAGNLKPKPGRTIIDTGQNTLLDSLRFALETAEPGPFASSLPERFFLFVLHRQENLMNEKLICELLDLVEEKSKSLPCVFVVHKPAEQAFKRLGVMERLEKAPGIITTPRLPYIEFMQVLGKCEFLATDGGSNQEESYYFGKPCLVLREHTERIEGLDANVLLSKNDMDVIRAFFADPKRHARPGKLEETRPAEIVVNELCAFLDASPNRR